MNNFENCIAMTDEYVIHEDKAYLYENLASWMDDSGLCEWLHNEMAPCTNQEFSDEYARRFDATLTEEELEEHGGWYQQCANVFPTWDVVQDENGNLFINKNS